MGTVPISRFWALEVVGDPEGDNWSRTFPGLPDQVPTARRFVVALLREHPRVVCLSELAANAVLHSRSGQSGGKFRVRVAAGPAVRVAVDDQGGHWDARADPEGIRGRGLAIVRSLADDFGITGDCFGRTAWFTLNGRV